MESIVNSDRLLAWFLAFRDFLQMYITTEANLLQIPAIFVTLFAAWLIARVIDPWLRRIARNAAVDDYQEAFYVQNLVPLSLPGLWAAALWTSVMVAREFGWPTHLVSVAVDLAAAWLLVRFASALIPNATIARIVAIVAWTIAALHVLGLLTPAVILLQKVSFSLGAARVSLLTVVEALLTLGVLLWAAGIAGRFAERRLAAVPALTATAKVLFGKLAKIALISLALFFTLAAAGIDLTALAVFTGAVGVGIGFGLQRTVSNLFAGIVLLLDKSIKPGDILEVGGTFGWVASLGARYVEVETRDGTQFLIPNEDIITHQVFNWTHQNDNVRLKIRVRVTYDTDVRMALTLMREAAGRPPRVLKTPAPNPLVIGFGESGLDLELRFWIADVRNGIHNVSSDVFLEILDLFHEHGIKIPLPQLDLHVQSLPATSEQRRVYG
ncbi:MAG TPA: mechanosensitive ion channel domain-containing protein [Rhodospirillales bacterium]|nr:mechanosensitive ion channel domain-containing protein [Rhodospirillales bacterium]